MISRRSLLTGLSILPLAGGIAGCAARASTSGANTAGGNSASGSAPVLGGPIPVVSPGARWNGTALSGGTPPTNPTRMTAKPAVQWWTKQNTRFGDGNNLLVGVDAAALGGVAYVDFWVEGTVQRVTAPTVFSDTDVNGNTRLRYGWWTYINLAACLAQTSNVTGALNIYATATPNDMTMQARRTPALTVYSALKQYDWVSTVNSTQAVQTSTQPYNYKTVIDALAALSAAITGGTAQCGDIQYTQSGTFEWNTTSTGTQNFTVNPVTGKGLSRLRVSGGQTATIIRYNLASSFGTAFDPTRGRTNSTTTLENAINDPWQMVNPIGNFEYVGSNLIFDMKNWFGFCNCTSVNDVLSFNGCTITNSTGTAASSYWNGHFHPGITASQLGHPALANSYGENATISYATAAGGLMTADLQCSMNGCLSTPYFNPLFVSGGYYANANLAGNEFYFHDYIGGFTATTPLLTLTYSGTSATAWVDLSAIPSGRLSFYTGDAGQANPVLVHTYILNTNVFLRGKQLVANDTNGWDLISQIVTDINSGRFAGWTATYTDTLNRGFDVAAINGHDFGYYTSPTGGTGATTVNCKSGSAQPIACFHDIHSEGIHYLGFPADTGSIVRGKVFNNVGFSTNFINEEAAGSLQDAHVLSVACNSNDTSTSACTWGGSGCVLANCSLDRGIVLLHGTTDAHSAILNCVSPFLIASGGSFDCTATGNVAGAVPSGRAYLSNQAYATWAAQFNGVTTGDFSPKTGSALYTNPGARLTGTAFDANSNPYAVSDAAGAMARGFNPPSRPF
jgi:hypothetical protein